MELANLSISPQMQKKLNAKGIFSVEDLLSFLPRKYNDFREETGILPDSEISCLVLHIEAVNSYNNKISTVVVSGTTTNGEPLSVCFFNQSWLRAKYAGYIGTYAYVAGKVTYNDRYNNYSIAAPVIFETNIAAGKKIHPVYSKIQGVSDQYLRDKIKLAIDISTAVPEPCPYSIVDIYHLQGMRDTYYDLHFPKTMEQIEKAQDRLLFNDLLWFALNIEANKRDVSATSTYKIKRKKDLKEILDMVPFELTEDQKSSVNSMLDTAYAGKRINALVQGDVGCGKSIIAFSMMMLMAYNGYQSVLMAPTQVLAQQHYDELMRLFGLKDIGIVFLGSASSMQAAVRKKVLKEIESGEAKIIVGTHAVLSSSVTYHNLGMTITDEEHKFGVVQRNTLTEKAKEGVHNISMSATPIPRSLAQVVYGDEIQLYTIHTMPNGRKPVITGLSTGREKIYNYIIKQARKGRQAYVVCPMIDQNEDLEGVKSVEEVYEEYNQVLSKNGVKVKRLTGRDSKEETEKTILEFQTGKVQVLVATTVIEVGVNVPNATTMVITSAERFGLSTLHQLRGRVGRSDIQSYCVLESNNPTEKSIARLQIMCETTDGFKIAEADLANRGAGDLIGTQQAGSNKYVQLMLANPEKYKAALEAAKIILDENLLCPMLTKLKNNR